MDTLTHRCCPVVHGTPFVVLARHVLVLLPISMLFAAGCGKPNAASAVQSPEVEVASVVQKNVPIFNEWVATLDGYVNAQIQAQVTGSVIQQTYKEGSFVRKGQLLFQIDPRPFQALLDQANAQLAQAQAQLGKTEMDVDRDTPLAKERAIAQSQLDNDVQANKAAKAAVVDYDVKTDPNTEPALEQQIEQQENLLSVLLGQNPGDISRGQALTEQRQPPQVPPGLPSSLLERRPDVRQAEEQLVAANAEIGVARAAYFPQISLNGSGGFQSSALTNLFSGPAGAWSLGASLAQPIFTGGRLRSQVRLTEAQQQTATLFYQQSIQGAFRSVSDALVAYRKTREFRAQQESLFQSAQDAARLSHDRYTGGATGYLEVLTNETNAFG